MNPFLGGDMVKEDSKFIYGHETGIILGGM